MPNLTRYRVAYDYIRPGVLSTPGVEKIVWDGESTLGDNIEAEVNGEPRRVFKSVWEGAQQTDAGAVAQFLYRSRQTADQYASALANTRRLVEWAESWTESR